MGKPKLVKCRVCGHQVSDNAPACPGCGDAAARRSSTGQTSQLVKGLAWAFAITAGVTVLAIATSNNAPKQLATETPNTTEIARPNLDPGPLLAVMEGEEELPRARLTAARRLVSNFPNHEAVQRAQELIAEMEHVERLEASRRKWSYRRSEDPMTSKMSVSANVRSENRHEFDFPYGGPQRATLTIRRHPTYGNNVVFRIERGQLLCSSYGDCPIQVRFDEGQARRLKGNPPADHGSETIFIPNYPDFLRRMTAAKVLKIQANIYQQGAPVWEFDVSGFDDEQLK